MNCLQNPIMVQYRCLCLFSNPLVRSMDISLYWTQFSLLVFLSITFFFVSCIPVSQSYLLFINTVNCHASELTMQPRKAFSNLLKVYSIAETQSKCHLFHEIITDPSLPTEMPPHSVSISTVLINYIFCTQHFICSITLIMNIYNMNFLRVSII